METHLAEDGELVVGQEAVAAVEQEVAPSELLEAPVLPGDEAVRLLALCTATATTVCTNPQPHVLQHLNFHFSLQHRRAPIDTTLQ